MNPEDYINKAKLKYLNSNYIFDKYKYLKEKNDPYNDFIFEKKSKQKEILEEKIIKRIHKESIKKKLKAF